MSLAFVTSPIHWKQLLEVHLISLRGRHLFNQSTGANFRRKSYHQLRHLGQSGRRRKPLKVQDRIQQIVSLNLISFKNELLKIFVLKLISEKISDTR